MTNSIDRGNGPPLGSITKPQAFAEIVRRFVMEHRHAAA
jgi:hypothetical protein